jgi:hypothetical protein
MQFLLFQTTNSLSLLQLKRGISLSNTQNRNLQKRINCTESDKSTSTCIWRKQSITNEFEILHRCEIIMNWIKGNLFILLHGLNRMYFDSVYNLILSHTTILFIRMQENGSLSKTFNVCGIFWTVISSIIYCSGKTKTQKNSKTIFYLVEISKLNIFLKPLA